MRSDPRIIALTAHRIERVIIPAWIATAVLLGMAAIFAAGRAWAQTPGPSSDKAPSIAGRHAPAPADVHDCSRWATVETGFNPGPDQLPPSWGKPRPASSSVQADYNRRMGLCLGQRESPAN